MSCALNFLSYVGCQQYFKAPGSLPRIWIGHNKCTQKCPPNLCKTFSLILNSHIKSSRSQLRVIFSILGSHSKFLLNPFAAYRGRAQTKRLSRRKRNELQNLPNFCQNVWLMGDLRGNGTSPAKNRRQTRQKKLPQIISVRFVVSCCVKQMCGKSDVLFLKRLTYWEPGVLLVRNSWKGLRHRTVSPRGWRYASIQVTQGAGPKMIQRFSHLQRFLMDSLFLFVA